MYNGKLWTLAFSAIPFIEMAVCVVLQEGSDSKRLLHLNCGFDLVLTHLLQRRP